MNPSRVVSLLLVVVALVVLVVALSFFLQRKEKTEQEEEKEKPKEQKSAVPVVPSQTTEQSLLHVVTYLSEDQVPDLSSHRTWHLFRARSTLNYSFNNVLVTVASSDVEENPAYQKYTHTFPEPFKADAVVFDNSSRYTLSEVPVSELTVYWWSRTVLLLTFKTTLHGAVNQYHHFSAHKTPQGLLWLKLERDPNTPFDLQSLVSKLEEVNTTLGNGVALNLDEYLEGERTTYTTELGGTTTTVSLTKKTFDQDGFLKLTHKVPSFSGTAHRSFQLKKLLVSGLELSDLDLSKKPAVSLSVYWWYSLPLLAELELRTGEKQYLAYSVESNSWLTEVVPKLRTKLTQLRTKLSVPLTLDLSKKPTTAEETYTTNDVLVRVSPPDSTSQRGFPKYTHRFLSGEPHFVGEFQNLGNKQWGLPVLRATEVSVYYSTGVPLLLEFTLPGAGNFASNKVYYSNNGFGFWSKVLKTGETLSTDSVLKKLDEDNKRLVAANDKYVVDVSSKNDYLSLGKAVGVEPFAWNVPDYKVFKHTSKATSTFRFHKLSKLGSDVDTTGLTELPDVRNVFVFWFLENPLLVKLNVTPRASPAPAAGAAPAGVPGAGGPPGVAVGGGVAAAGTGTGTQPGSAPSELLSQGEYYLFDGQHNKWTKVDYKQFDTEQKLKDQLSRAKLSLGTVTVQMGHGAGEYVSGPVKVRVEKDEQYGLTQKVFDKMVHVFEHPFTVGKLNHFYYDVKPVHEVPVTTSQQPTPPQPQPQSTTPAPEQPSQPATQGATGAGQPVAPGAAQTAKVPFPLTDFVVKTANVYVYKYVPLAVELVKADNSTVLLANTFTGPVWEKFTLDTTVTGGAPTTLDQKLETLRRQLNSTASVDVCKTLQGQESATYQLPKTLGTENFQVTLTSSRGANGAELLTHALPQGVRLTSLKCLENVLTGLDPGEVQKVFVHLQDGVPVLVKTNSDPRYFKSDGRGTLQHHALPEGTTDLNQNQVQELVTQVTHNMGQVFQLNVNATERYTSASVNVELQTHDLEGGWKLHVHRLTPGPRGPGPQGHGPQTAPQPHGPPGPGGPRGPGFAEDLELVPEAPELEELVSGHGAQVAPHFTVSNFLQGTAAAVGLPKNKSYTGVFAVLKGDTAHLLGLKTVDPVGYEWYVLNRGRWLFHQKTTELYNLEELKELGLDVEDGLDNEYNLDLEPEVQNEAFEFDYHEYTPSEGLEGFTLQTYVPVDKKYPVVLLKLLNNGNEFNVPGVSSFHLKQVSSYAYFGEPLLLHCVTLDDESVFFENGFGGSWAKVDLGEFKNDALKARLNKLKEEALKFVSLNLTKTELYKSLGLNVTPTKEPATATGTETTNPLDPFTKWVHRLPALQAAEGATSGSTTVYPTFKVGKVLYNGVDLGFVLPAGTVPDAVVYLNSELVPLGLYLHSTVTTTAAPPPTPPTSEGQPQQATTTTTVVTHNYYFNNAGKWEPFAETNAALDNTKLKEKLTAANTSLGFHVEVDLAKKLPYVFARTVADGAPSVLDFLVHPSPNESYNFSTYTHVPQVRTTVAATTSEGQATVTTKDVFPFVSSYVLDGQRLRGFELSKLVKLTVYWLQDTYPLLVHVTTTTHHKFYRNKGNNNWVLLDKLTEKPTTRKLFELLELAKRGFAFELDLQLGVTTGTGYWNKYMEGPLPVKVTFLGKLGEGYKQFLHTSASPQFPTFWVSSLRLWDAFLYGGSDMGYVKSVRVFTDPNELPLVAEVAGQVFNRAKSPVKYTYYLFDLAFTSGWTLKPGLTRTSKMEDTEVVSLLESLKTVADNLVYLHLDATKDYASKGDTAVDVYHSSEKGLDSYSHKLPSKKSVVLYHKGKRVGFLNGTKPYLTALVRWYKGVPVWVKLTDRQETTNKDPSRGFDGTWTHFFYMPDGKWSHTLPFEVDLTKLESVMGGLLTFYSNFFTLDVGTRTVRSAFGFAKELELMELRHRTVSLPEGLVAYSLLPMTSFQFKLFSLQVNGWDLRKWNLPVTYSRVLEAHVFTPDTFYAPLFMELVTSEYLDPEKTSFLDQSTSRYYYFYATSAGTWTFLDTHGLQLDAKHLSLHLNKFVNPETVLVDLAKREGVYGFHEMTVRGELLHEDEPFTRYVHKLLNGEAFVVGRWAFGGVKVKNLPTVKARNVSVYFYKNRLPLLVEVKYPGTVRHFVPDFDGKWHSEVVNTSSVLSLLRSLVDDLALLANETEEWVPQLNYKFMKEFEFLPEETPVPVKVVPEPVTPPTEASTPPSEPVAAAPAPAGAPAPAVAAGGVGATAPGADVTRAQVASGSADAVTVPLATVSEGQRTADVANSTSPSVTTTAQTTGVVAQTAAREAGSTTGRPETVAETRETTRPGVQGSSASGVQPGVPVTQRPAEPGQEATVPTQADQTQSQVTNQGPSGASGPAGPSGTPQPGTPAQGPVGQQTPVTTHEVPAPTPAEVPAVNPTLTVTVAGSAAGVAPLALDPVVVKKLRRKFKLVPVDYDKLFYGYVTLGKLVSVSRFEAVPHGYNFAQHRFLKDEAKYFANKFWVGEKEYSLPEEHLKLPLKNRKTKSLGFYSWLNNPLVVKFAFEDKAPLFLHYNKNDDTWTPRTVVNLDEELEQLNHLYNNAYVFDLAKEAGKHHEYFNKTFYYLSEKQSPDANLFNVLEVESFEAVERPTTSGQPTGVQAQYTASYPPPNTTGQSQTSVSSTSNVDGTQGSSGQNGQPSQPTGEQQTTPVQHPAPRVASYRQVPFKLSKLRYRAVDLPLEGLPVGLEAYTLRAYLSKDLDKLLYLVLYEDEDDSERKRFESKNPGKFAGHHYHVNLDGTWTFFEPKGENAVLNKLLELEKLLMEPPFLDLAKVTGPTNVSNYWTKQDEFVVERVFLELPQTLLATPVLGPPSGPHPGARAPAPQGPPGPAPAVEPVPRPAATSEGPPGTPAGPALGAPGTGPGAPAGPVPHPPAPGQQVAGAPGSTGVTGPTPQQGQAPGSVPPAVQPAATQQSATPGAPGSVPGAPQSPPTPAPRPADAVPAAGPPTGPGPVSPPNAAPRPDVPTPGKPGVQPGSQPSVGVPGSGVGAPAGPSAPAGSTTTAPATPTTVASPTPTASTTPTGPVAGAPTGLPPAGPNVPAERPAPQSQTPASAPRTLPEPVARVEVRAAPPTKVDPLVGLEEEEYELTTGLYVDVPLEPYFPPPGPEAERGFELFYHHVPYFVKRVTVTPPAQPAPPVGPVPHSGAPGQQVSGPPGSAVPAAPAAPAPRTPPVSGQGPAPGAPVGQGPPGPQSIAGTAQPPQTVPPVTPSPAPAVGTDGPTVGAPGSTGVTGPAPPQVTGTQGVPGAPGSVPGAGQSPPTPAPRGPEPVHAPVPPAGPVPQPHGQPQAPVQPVNTPNLRTTPEQGPAVGVPGSGAVPAPNTQQHPPPAPSPVPPGDATPAASASVPPATGGQPPAPNTAVPVTPPQPQPAPASAVPAQQPASNVNVAPSPGTTTQLASATAASGTAPVLREPVPATPAPQQVVPQSQTGQLVETKKVVFATKFMLGDLHNNGFPLEFEVPFEANETGWAGLTVLYEKNFNTPFAFALFNPKENKGNLENAHYEVWLYKNLKWVKTSELENYYDLLRALELKLDVARFGPKLAKFREKLNELSTLSKEPLTYTFSVELNQGERVTNGTVVVTKEGDHVNGVDLFKTTFTPKLATPGVGEVNFTLDKVTLFENKFKGLKLPLTRVVELNLFFRNQPDTVARLPTLLEVVQKLPKGSFENFKHWYYLYDGSKNWKLHLSTTNKLEDHEVFDLVNYKLYENYRLSTFFKNAVLLDLDTKFTHLSLGRLVDSVEFTHDATPQSTTSPVPKGFVLVRHSLVTENTTFYLPFAKVHGQVTATECEWPFSQYFVYYKVGDENPFVVVLAQADAVNKPPVHHWYYMNGRQLLKFGFKTDVDPDDPASREVLAETFPQLLLAPPKPLEDDTLVLPPPENQRQAVPAFPATSNLVLSKKVNGVANVEPTPRVPELAPKTLDDFLKAAKHTLPAQ